MKYFLDMDNTIADSQKAFINTYCARNMILFCNTYTEKWDFSDRFPTITNEEIIDVFTSDLYFQLLEPLKGASERVKQLTDNGDMVYIITMCHPKVVQKKMEWLQKYFPTAIYIPIVSKIHDKSIINMDGGIYIDDRPDVLENSNADAKIMFKCKGNCDWQQEWDGIYFDNWKENTIFD